MKKLIAILSLALLPITGFASGAGPELESAGIDLTDKASLQRGAKYFVNYCQGCHTAKYFRYERLQDFDLSIEDITQNLMFGDSRTGDHMTIAMPVVDAAEWFGAAPPDLTLTARLKHGGADWLYSYLKGFYADDSRPMGVNNTVFPNVGMPHVLWEMQGVQQAVFKEDAHGNKVVDHLEAPVGGSMSPEEYDSMARDLATFMAHIAEPMKLERQRIGIYVMLFLLVFFVVAIMLKKEFWKDVH
jgi:ubiquinol-cytochrome c reductase cytochrome c1 subunit